MLLGGGKRSSSEGMCRGNVGNPDAAGGCGVNERDADDEVGFGETKVGKLSKLGVLGRGGVLRVE